MEDILIVFLIIFSVIVTTLGAIYLAKSIFSKQKKAIKTVKEENIEEIISSYRNSMEILKEQNEFLTEDCKLTKKRLGNALGVNTTVRNENGERIVQVESKNLEADYEIDVNNAMKLVESMNLPFLDNINKSKIPSLINNPLIKNKIWSYIKDHKDEMISLSVIIPKGQIQNEPKEEEKQKDGDPMNLAFNTNNEKYMA